MTLAPVSPTHNNDDKLMIAISEIKIGNRFRKDLGDIDSLAKSIQEIGLLHPIVINENNELVAGHRRIEAAKKLGWAKIPCTVVNISDIIKGELIENIVRKDFGFSERQAILEAVETQRIGHKISKDKVSKLETFAKQNKGKPSVDIVSKYTGVSTGQLSNEKYVYLCAKKIPDEFGYLIDMIDHKMITVHEAKTRIENHYRTKRELEEEAEARKHREEQKQKREQSLLLGERGLDYENEYKKTSSKLFATKEKYDKQVEITRSLTEELERTKHKLSKIQPQPQQDHQHQIETKTTLTTSSNNKNRVNKLKDYDPTMRDSYDRQTLYKIIDWLFDELRKLRTNQTKKEVHKSSL